MTNQRIEENRIEEVPASCPSDTQQPVTKSVRERKAPSPKKETDPRVKRVLDHFHDEHLRIIGEKYHVIGGRDSAAIKRLLVTFPEEELRGRITRYLEDPLGWMDHPQHTIPGFEKGVNAYGTQRGDIQKPRRESSYVDDEAWKFPRLE